jgi:glc operon protein GlcG
MRGFRILSAIVGLGIACLSGSVAFAQGPAAPPQLISRAEVRAIIDGAIAYATEKGTLMGVAVVDTSGELIGSERMDGAASRNVRFAEAKAFTSAMYRQPTQQLADLYKTRPDRYFGIMNMYGSKVYLVGGGVPLALDNKLIGAVGVAGLPEGEDEKAGRAGIAAWMKFRETMKK